MEVVARWHYEGIALSGAKL
jgi:hypothetical protein